MTCEEKFQSTLTLCGVGTNIDERRAGERDMMKKERERWVLSKEKTQASWFSVRCFSIKHRDPFRIKARWTWCSSETWRSLISPSALRKHPPRLPSDLSPSLHVRSLCRRLRDNINIKGGNERQGAWVTALNPTLNTAFICIPVVRLAVACPRAALSKQTRN